MQPALGLEPVVVVIEGGEEQVAEEGEPEGEEWPDEPLGEVPEVAAVVFAVALPHPLALVGKHFADFSEMLTVTFDHPLSLLGKERFNPLHIGIGGMNCHVQPRRGFLYHAIDVVVDGIDFFTDCPYGVVQC